MKELTEDEVSFLLFDRTPQPSYRPNLFVCHHCKQPGHIKNQCPSLLVSSVVLFLHRIPNRFQR
jgi:hypothetical protein